MLCPLSSFLQRRSDGFKRLEVAADVDSAHSRCHQLLNYCLVRSAEFLISLACHALLQSIESVHALDLSVRVLGVVVGEAAFSFDSFCTWLSLKRHRAPAVYAAPVVSFLVRADEQIASVDKLLLSCLTENPAQLLAAFRHF